MTTPRRPMGTQMRRRDPKPEAEGQTEQPEQPKADTLPDNHGRLVRDVGPGPIATVKPPGAHVGADGRELPPYNQIHEAQPAPEAPVSVGHRSVGQPPVPTHQIGGPNPMQGARAVQGHTDPRAVPGTPPAIYRIQAATTQPGGAQRVDARQAGPTMDQRFSQPNAGAVKVGGAPRPGMAASVIAVPGELNAAQAAHVMAQASGQPQTGRSQFQGRAGGGVPVQGGPIPGIEKILQQNNMATIGLADEATTRREMEAAGLGHRMPQTTLNRRVEQEPVAPVAVGERLDLTVVLSAFSRPGLLRTQIDALRRGTKIPAMVVVLVGQGVSVGDALADGSPWVKGEIPHTTYGLPVTPWERFRVAAKMQTRYVAILDDDCIPGPGWLEACVDGMEQGVSCVVAAAGSRLGDDGSEIGYRGPSTDEGSNDVIVSDVEGPSDLPVVVDVGEMGWFLRREWMPFVADIPAEEPPYGWQIHVSAALASQGIPTVVLPYTQNRTIWGSRTPPLADGLRNVPQMKELRASEFSTYRDEGWQLVSALSENERVIWPKGQEPKPKLEPGVYFNKKLDRYVSPGEPEWSAEHYELLTGEVWSEPPAQTDEAPSAEPATDEVAGEISGTP